MTEQAYVFAVLAATLALFILDRWRYDIVALLALMAVAIPGIIPAAEVFGGFGHPAVVTVAAVLVVSRGLAASGLVEALAQRLGRMGSSPTMQIAVLTTVVAVGSAFMNNVGALALIMPVALRLASRNEISPSLVLMPIAFGSLLGGMTTLIGTPPNIIIANARVATGEPAFGMFAYSPVGLAVAVVGIAFITFLGWHLIPVREGQASAEAMFEIKDYTTELLIPEDSTLDGSPLREINQGHDVEVVVLAIVRGRQKIFSPSGSASLAAGDSLIVEVEPANLQKLLHATGLKLASHAEDLGESDLRSKEFPLIEAVVKPRAPLQGRHAEEMELRARYGLNLLAVARHGARIRKQLKNIRFQAGDVLLIQAHDKSWSEALAALGCLPLAARELKLFAPQRMLLALAIFGGAIALLVSRLTSAPVALTAAALLMVLTGIVQLRDAYRAIDWPVIVLLGGMIPVGEALERTGGAAWIAARLVDISSTFPPWAILTLTLILAMFLSDVMNNAATAVIMAPISIQVAQSLGLSPDPFLMAVAVGASCAFLTPIGHQSNTLVMGPGGYRFGDYWRMGLPLELLIVVLGVPMILWVWPLGG